LALPLSFTFKVFTTEAGHGRPANRDPGGDRAPCIELKNRMFTLMVLVFHLPTVGGFLLSVGKFKILSVGAFAVRKPLYFVFVFVLGARLPVGGSLLSGGRALGSIGLRFCRPINLNSLALSLSSIVFYIGMEAGRRSDRDPGGDQAPSLN